MFDVRLTFSKTGDAAYMSHLDLMRAIQRVIRRAALPARYSQGFNPHLVLSILSPLSTGYCGLRELCDFSLEGKMDFCEITRRLNAVMPGGMRAIAAAAPKKKAALIGWSDYEIRFPRGGDSGAMRELFSASVIMNKRSKRGEKSVDLLEYIREIAFESAGGDILCHAVLRAGTDPLNPRYIAAALAENSLTAPGCVPVFTRCAILDENAEIFL